MSVERHETAVQLKTFFLKHAHRNLYACVAQLLYAAALHLGKGVYASYHHAPYALAHNEVGARRRAAVMRTWLEAHIHGRLAEQCPILRLHRRKGVHFGVAFAASYMISLAYYAAVFAHNNGPHHRVWPCRKPSAACQLKAPAHIHFVFFSLFHAANILQVNEKQKFTGARFFLYFTPEALQVYKKILKLQFFLYDIRPKTLIFVISF